MRPRSSKDRATGLTTLGSEATNSMWKPFFTWKVLRASLGSTAGMRGRSLEVTVGSAAARERHKQKRRRDRAKQYFILRGASFGDGGGDSSLIGGGAFNKRQLR